MKLQRTTLILLLVALGFAGFVYVVEIQGDKREEAREARTKQVFNFTQDQVQQIQITQPDEETLLLERQADGETDWVMKEPKSAPASDASVMFLLDKLVSSKSDRTLTLSENQLAEYGLDKPWATLDITLNDGKTHQLSLGKLDFTESLIYAQVKSDVTTAVKDEKMTAKSSNSEVSDTEVRSLEVVLIPIEFQYAVNRPLSEWEQQEAEKPIEVSPSPSPNLEASPSPSSNLEVSPSPSPNLEGSPSPSPNLEGSPSPSPNLEVSPSPSSNLEVSPSPSPNLEVSPSPSPNLNLPVEETEELSPNPQ